VFGIENGRDYRGEAGKGTNRNADAALADYSHATTELSSIFTATRFNN
jgi:hypothetical protein